MALFWFGALCGGVTMLMTGVFLGAQVVDEKDQQIKYLHDQLRERAKNER